MMKSIVFFLWMATVVVQAQDKPFANFPESADPLKLGERMSNRFIALNKHTLYRGQCINYMEVCNWLGALRYAELVGNRVLIHCLQDRFEPLFTTEKAIVPEPVNVDLAVFGALPLELYQATGDKRYYDMGMAYAEAQWTLPDNATEEQKRWADGNLSWHTRLWIDDMYMITFLQAQAYKVTGNRKYIDRAAKEMVVYLDSLQKSDGLFYHAPDVPFFWGRGNGWMAAGMTELLKALPEEHPDRKRIMKGYLTMMERLKKYRSENGIWNQLVDAPDCWAETSGSAMFAFALITGIKAGWLKAKDYGEVARKAWITLTGYVNVEGDITDVCVGTNKKNDRRYYYERPRATGDYHGQAAMLWCACALLENEDSSWPTKGGEGGRVITVTSLEEKGPGTLREALDFNEPRIIRFAVAGEIWLSDVFRIRNPHLTIDADGGHEGYPPLTVDAIGNVVIAGHDTKPYLGIFHNRTGLIPGSQVYLNENMTIGVASFDQTERPLNRNRDDPTPFGKASVVKLPVTVTPLPVMQVEATVLTNAGARINDRDMTDNRIINEVKTRTGQIRNLPEDKRLHPDPSVKNPQWTTKSNDAPPVKENIKRQ
jgi:rhamnogalacturonyl hydrolase YesR